MMVAPNNVSPVMKSVMQVLEGNVSLVCGLPLQEKSPTSTNRRVWIFPLDFLFPILNNDDNEVVPSTIIDST